MWHGIEIGSFPGAIGSRPSLSSLVAETVGFVSVGFFHCFSVQLVIVELCVYAVVFTTFSLHFVSDAFPHVINSL